MIESFSFCRLGKVQKNRYIVYSVAEPEPEETYYFDPIRTRSLSLLQVPVPVPGIKIAPFLLKILRKNKRNGHLVYKTQTGHWLTHGHEAAEKEKNKVNGQIFQCKNILTLKGRNRSWNRNRKTNIFWTQNQNLGKTARLRKTDCIYRIIYGNKFDLFQQ